MWSKTKRQVAKAKEKAYDELYEKLATEKGEKVLYHLTRVTELGRMCIRPAAGRRACASKVMRSHCHQNRKSLSTRKAMCNLPSIDLMLLP
ncbi:hypothetical protein SK128_001463 [Halocaridina rubra]|uniref:Uncharacterized protein n=1 Tax=Halocaridina rubra TaxID=373956 RepID=A0AAN9AC00_HALRR